jgi:rhodanese-related sulfurtransferase
MEVAMNKYRLLFGTMVTIIALCTACGGSRGYRSISPQELADFDEDELFLVDTNPTNEGRIPGTDAHIPFDEVKTHAGELPADKGARVAVYCTAGGRSSRAARTLVDLGYTNVLHLDGGLDAWRDAGYEVE